MNSLFGFSPENKPTLAISQCLMGDNVRFNGGHKQSRYCTDVLSEYFNFLPICPEVEIGMGVPREPIRLIGTDRGVEVVSSSDSSKVYTQSLRDLADKKIPLLSSVAGYIFMQKSPSCGVERVKVYNAKNHPQWTSAGIYSERVMARLPLLPVEEAGRLMDAPLRENFVMRVYLYAHWQKLQQASGFTAKGLLEFHQSIKLLVMAHNFEVYRALGNWLSCLKGRDLSQVAHRYFELLMHGLSKPATRKHHANVLARLQGFLGKSLSVSERVELTEVIAQYRKGIMPLVAPLLLIRHHLRLREDDKVAQYVLSQRYMNPYPLELGLRNAI